MVSPTAQNTHKPADVCDVDAAHLPTPVSTRALLMHAVDGCAGSAEAKLLELLCGIDASVT
jgi:hypothetical protein